MAGGGLAGITCSGFKGKTEPNWTFLYFILSEGFGSSDGLCSQRSSDAANLRSQSSAGATAGKVNAVEK